MRTLLFAIITLLTISFTVRDTRSQTIPDTLWMKTYGTFSQISCTAIVSDGNYIIVGGDVLFGRVVIAAFDKNGDSAWVTLLPKEISSCAAIFCSEDNATIIGNWRGVAGEDEDVGVVQLNNTGQVTNLRHYGGPLQQKASSATRANDGSIMVCGTISCDLPRKRQVSDFWMLRLSVDGDSLWSKRRCTGLSANPATVIEPTRDGGFVLVDAFNLYRVDSLGEEVWHNNSKWTRFGGIRLGLQQSPKGDIFVRTWTQNQRSNIIEKISAKGKSAWEYRPPTGCSSFLAYPDFRLATIEFDKSGNGFILGTENIRGETFLSALVINEKGQCLQNRVWEGRPVEKLLISCRLPDGSLVLAGRTIDNRYSPLTIVKLGPLQ